MQALAGGVELASERITFALEKQQRRPPNGELPRLALKSIEEFITFTVFERAARRGGNTVTKRSSKRLKSAAATAIRAAYERKR